MSTKYPDKLLADIRENLEEAEWCIDNIKNYSGSEFTRIASQFAALDEWLKSGGQLPVEWTKES